MPAQTQKVDDFIRSVLISRNENKTLVTPENLQPSTDSNA